MAFKGIHGPITNLLSVQCILIEILSHAHAKGAKSLSDFKFGTFISHFPRDGVASTAVKRLKKWRCFLLLLRRLAEENETLSKQKEKLQEKLQKYTVYHRYMEKVLEAGEEFHELRDIIARWDTLTATHQVPASCLVCVPQLSSVTLSSRLTLFYLCQLF